MKKVLLLVLGLLCTPAYADSTIDALSAAGALAGTESVPIFQTANPAVKATTGAIGNAGALTGDVTKSAGSGVTTLAAGSASNLNAGTLAAARMPALTGDCTTSAGAVATTCFLPRHPGYVSANWYQFANALPAGSGNALQANRIVCHFAVVAKQVTITDLGVGIGTAGSSNIQLALYANASGRPAALIGNTGSIANNVSATTITGALAANKAVGPGGSDGGAELWFCANQNDSTATYATSPASGPGPGIWAGSPTATQMLVGAANGNMNGIYCAGGITCGGGPGTFGTWPASLAGSTWVVATPGTSGMIVPQGIFKVQ
jgi:hypothetical protein